MAAMTKNAACSIVSTVLPTLSRRLRLAALPAGYHGKADPTVGRPNRLVNEAAAFMKAERGDVDAIAVLKPSFGRRGTRLKPVDAAVNRAGKPEGGVGIPGQREFRRVLYGPEEPQQNHDGDAQSTGHRRGHLHRTALCMEASVLRT
jgi:hypothetical protein